MVWAIIESPRLLITKQLLLLGGFKGAPLPERPLVWGRVSDKPPLRDKKYVSKVHV